MNTPRNPPVENDEDDHRLAGGQVPEEQGGQGEYGSRSDRFPGGGHGLHDVVFQDGIPAEKPPQDSHRDHRGGDRCRHRHPDFQAEIGIRGAEHDRQQNPQAAGQEGQFRQ